MTKNEARKYIEDPANWHVMQTGKYVRFSILTYKSIRIGKIEAMEVINTFEHLRMGEERKAGFRTVRMYEMSGDYMTYSCSLTQLTEQIWKESKA